MVSVAKRVRAAQEWCWFEIQAGHTKGRRKRGMVAMTEVGGWSVVGGWVKEEARLIDQTVLSGRPFPGLSHPARPLPHRPSSPDPAHHTWSVQPPNADSITVPK